MYKLITIILLLPLLGLGCKSAELGKGGANIIDDLDTLTISSTLKSEQLSYYLANGKYKFVPEGTFNGIKYKVFEYLCPDGSKGWHVFLEKADGSRRSFGEGCEARAYGYEWTPPITTTTPVIN